MAQLLGFYGFGMRFVCEDDGQGNPYDYLEVYRKDAAGPTDPKQIYLPESGSDLTEAITNLSALHAGFDFHGVANDIFVESHLERYEVSVILAPGFEPHSGDGANKTQFLKSNIDGPDGTPALRQAYRYYIVDECGDGYYDVGAQQFVDAAPFDFSALLQDDVTGEPDYVQRYRPGRGTIFSKDVNNKPYHAQLAVASYSLVNTDAPPHFYDVVLNQSTAWQEIAPDTWNLLPDRLGIVVIAPDVEAWKIGVPPKGKDPKSGNQWPYTSGVLRGITGQADPTAKVGEQQFLLRLTCVIEGDRGIGTEAQRRDASPLANTVQRRIDASDHFHYDYVDTSSIYNVASNPLYNNGDPIPAQDDTTRALAHATQLRSAHEFPPLTAAVTIPYLVEYLSVGDRIDEIDGRDVSLLVNAGAEQGEAASYPYVVAVTWDFSGEKQATTVQLSDRRQEPRLRGA